MYTDLPNYQTNSVVNCLVNHHYHNHQRFPLLGTSFAKYLMMRFFKPSLTPSNIDRFFLKLTISAIANSLNPLLGMYLNLTGPVFHEYLQNDATIIFL